MGVRFPLPSPLPLPPVACAMPLACDKLIVGLDERSPLAELLDFGVRQFYGGFVPSSWTAAYGPQLSPNRRYRVKEQFCDPEQLRERIAEIHRHGGSFELALNAPYLTEELLPQALRIAEQATELGADGIIVGSLPLLLALRDQGYQRITASSLLGMYSTAAISFFQEHFAPVKFILPRDLLLDEIDTIAAANPTAHFEVFLFGDHCRLSEPYCFVEHGFDSVAPGDLCRFAQRTRRYHRREHYGYAGILRNRGLTDDEQRSLLAGGGAHPPDILAKIETGLVAGDQAGVARAIDQFSRLDYQGLLRDDKMTLARAINLFRQLASSTDAQQIGQALEKMYRLPGCNEDVIQHKLNSSAIADSVGRFSRHPNIVSYKIPSRGRDVLRMLRGAAADEGITEAEDYRSRLYRP